MEARAMQRKVPPKDDVSRTDQWGPWHDETTKTFMSKDKEPVSLFADDQTYKTVI